MVHKSLIVSFIAVLAAAFFLTADVTAQDASRELSWRQTDTSVELLCGDKMVWRHVHDAKIGKPFMRIALTDGTELTRPWPYENDYLKTDHRWHRALWWSWKTVDGVNYWEGNQEGTEPVKVDITKNDDGSAVIELAIEYHLPDQPPVALEKRTIRISAPDEQGNYLIDWQATFTPAGDKDVVFGRNGYGGFALRMAAEYCPDTPGQGWEFVPSKEEEGASPKGSRWMMFQGEAQNGRPAAVAIFDHPKNPSYPSVWCLRTQYPYMNPCLIARKPYTLKAGESLTLRYGVSINDGPADPEAVEKQWKSFVSE